MIDKQSMLKRFSSNEEKLQFSKLMDLYIQSEKRRTTLFSDFLDPSSRHRFLEALKTIPGNRMAFHSSGGYPGAERCILSFGYEETPVYPISVLHIQYHHRFSKTLTHRDFLGALAGLGLSRAKMGDILLREEAGAYAFVEKSIGPYIEAQLERVGHTAVKVTPVTDGSFLEETRQEADCIRLTVASLRIDAVLAAGFKLSRGKAEGLIQGEKAFANWVPVKNGAKQVEEADVLTLRGYGRLVVKGIVGKSKKGRIVLEVSRTR